MNPIRTILSGVLAACGLLLTAGLAGAAHHEHAAEEVKEKAAPAEEAAAEPHLGMDTPDGYVVQPGDTLARIAQDHLGAAELWRHIAEANDIDDPKALRVGQRLRIPEREADWLVEDDAP